MISIQDTREKVDKKHYLYRYFKKHNIEVVRRKLDVGDYMLPDGKLSIDLKGGGLLELGNDLYSDKKAFFKKYRKCYEQKIGLVVLIEEDIPDRTALISWKNEHTKLTGREIMELMHTIEVSYGVKCEFCKREETAERIVNILLTAK